MCSGQGHRPECWLAEQNWADAPEINSGSLRILAWCPVVGVGLGGGRGEALLLSVLESPPLGRGSSVRGSGRPGSLRKGLGGEARVLCCELASGDRVCGRDCLAPAWQRLSGLAPPVYLVPQGSWTSRTCRCLARPPRRAELQGSWPIPRPVLKACPAHAREMGTPVACHCVSPTGWRGEEAQGTKENRSNSGRL